MQRTHKIAAVASWVLAFVGLLFGALILLGTSWNGVRQHVIEWVYLCAVPLPLLAAVIAGGLLWSGCHTQNIVRYVLITLPVLLACGFIVVISILFCSGVLR